MSLFCLNSQSNAQQKKDNAETKILVAYFHVRETPKALPNQFQKLPVEHCTKLLQRKHILLPTLTGETKTAEVQ